MAHEMDDNVLSQVYEVLVDTGFDGLAEALTLLLNEVMRLERSQHLQAQPYERSAERRGYANGYKPKRVRTRIGELALAVPQVREGDFYPSSLEKGLRSERALKLALAEMYVQGVSTRKLQRITEEMCGFSVSSSDVSRAAALLDEELEAWRTRPLGAYRYVFLDARYEHVRHGGNVVTLAVLVATGIREADGRREVLGCSVSLSEHEVHWRTFLQELKRRGLHGVRLFTSDAHEGLKKARSAVFPAVPWQRCQTHLQRNAQRYVPRQLLRKRWRPISGRSSTPLTGLMLMAAAAPAGQVCSNGTGVGGLGRREPGRRIDHFRLSGSPSSALADNQYGRAAEQGGQAPHQGGDAVS